MCSGSIHIHSSDLFNIGDTLKLTIDGSCVFVEIIDIDINFETMALYFKIRLKNGFERTVTKEHLSPKDAENLFQLPITASQVREHDKYLEIDTLQDILHPQALPPWFPEFMFSNDRLGHLPFAEIFKLVDCG